MSDTDTMAPATADSNADTGGFIWYELMTSDPAAAKAFYDAVVGWRIDDHNTASAATEVDYRMINRSDGGFAGGMLVLTDDMTSHGARPTWLGYLHVADVDRALEAIEADGGRTMMPAHTMEGVGRMAMVTDPQGAAFYLMAPAPPAGQPDAKSDVFSVDQPQRVRWNELAEADQDGAIAFYAKHFGWGQEGAMPMGDMGDYKFVQQGGVTIGAIMREHPGRPGNGWHFYFGVDDIDRAAKAVTDGGGQLVGDINQIPGGEYAVHCADPAGAGFGLVGPRK